MDSTLRDFYCFHCHEFVSKATFYRHRSRYFINGQWKNNDDDCLDCNLEDNDFSNQNTSEELVATQTMEPMEDLPVVQDHDDSINGMSHSYADEATGYAFCVTPSSA